MPQAASERDRDPRPRGERAAAVVFGCYVAVALPLIVFVLADHRWFLRDDWAFLSGRDLSVSGLFEPHFGQHLSVVPVIVFRGLWWAVGARTYVPYQLLVAGMHLGVVVLLRALLRRLQVGPWLATAAASMLVLWGPAGGDNLVWAFQINFVGSVLFGLGQLLLADHGGGSWRRDLLAVVVGLLGVLSSGIGLTMLLAVGLAIFLRRGWRAAAVQTVPPAVVVALWFVTMHPTTVVTPPGPPPDVATTLRWVDWTVTGTFAAVGRFRVVAVVMALVILFGLVLRLRSAAGASPTPVVGLRRRIEPAAIPLAMMAAGLVFPVMTARGRWFFGEAAARSGRYLYVLAVLLIPALAVGAEAIARRWPRARVALLLLLLVPIPFNLDGFDEPPIDARYFVRSKALITGTPEMALARQVPRGNHPPGYDPTMGEDMTVGFLLDARDAGRLPRPSRPLSPELRDELTIRLALQQEPATGSPRACPAITTGVRMPVERGATVYIRSLVVVALASPSTDRPVRVPFEPGPDGSELVLQVGDLPLVIAPARRASEMLVCLPDE